MLGLVVSNFNDLIFCRAQAGLAKGFHFLFNFHFAVYNVQPQKVSSQLTTSSTVFTRPDKSGNYYYGTFQISVPRTSQCLLRSNSSTNLDTYGYLYSAPFYPQYPSINQIGSNDDGAGFSQFMIVAVLQPGINYIVVATTYSNSATGLYTFSALCSPVNDEVVTNPSSTSIGKWFYLLHWIYRQENWMHSAPVILLFFQTETSCDCDILSTNSHFVLIWRETGKNWRRLLAFLY